MHQWSYDQTSLSSSQTPVQYATAEQMIVTCGGYNGQSL